MYFERPVPRSACLVIANCIAERLVSRLPDDSDDQPHLRVDAAKPVDVGYPADGKHVRGGAEIHPMLARKLEHVLEAATHDCFQPVVDELLGPEVSTAILNPLEIGNGHTACIRENVRNHEHTFFVEDGI